MIDKIINPINASDLFYDYTKDIADVYSQVDLANVPTPYEGVQEIVGEVTKRQDKQLKNAQKVIKNQNKQIAELQKANNKLQEQVELLVKQNEELEKQAMENEKQMKKQKWWNWITFILSLGVAIASLVVAI